MIEFITGLYLCPSQLISRIAALCECDVCISSNCPVSNLVATIVKPFVSIPAWPHLCTRVCYSDECDPLVRARIPYVIPDKCLILNAKTVRWAGFPRWIKFTTKTSFCADPQHLAFRISITFRVRYLGSQNASSRSFSYRSIPFHTWPPSDRSCLAI